MCFVQQKVLCYIVLLGLNLESLLNSVLWKSSTGKKAKILTKEVKKLEEFDQLISARTERFNTLKAHLILLIFIQHRSLLNTKREKQEIKASKILKTISHKAFSHPSALHIRYASYKKKVKLIFFLVQFAFLWSRYN